MKIFHIITGLKVGGAESALYNFLVNMIDRYKTQHVVAYFYHGPNVAKIEALGVQTYHITGMIHKYDPVAYYRLKAEIQKHVPDIIHTALWSATIFGRLLAKSLDIPVICDIHGNSKHEGWLRNIVDRKTALIPQKIVAVGHGVKNIYQQNILMGLPRDKSDRLTVIKNGIGVRALINRALTEKIERRDTGLPSAAFVVGSVGRLEKIKSYDILIRSFKLFIDMLSGEQKIVPRLCLVGDGSQRKSLELLVHELNLDKQVVFFGERNDCYRLYPLFDCFALSSQSEGLSIALLEAMALSLPIITTNDGMQHEVVTHGVHGLLMPKNDIKAFACGLKQLYEQQELRKAMAYKNKQLVQQSYDIDKTVDQYYSLYKELL